LHRCVPIWTIHTHFPHNPERFCTNIPLSVYFVHIFLLIFNFLAQIIPQLDHSDTYFIEPGTISLICPNVDNCTQISPNHDLFCSYVLIWTLLIKVLLNYDMFYTHFTPFQPSCTDMSLSGPFLHRFHPIQAYLLQISPNLDLSYANKYPFLYISYICQKIFLHHTK